LKFHHLLFLRYRNQFRAELNSELRPATNSLETRAKLPRDVGTFIANRWVWIGEEALVGKAYEQRRFAHRSITCKTITPSVSTLKRPRCGRVSRLASNDEFENIMPCYTSHSAVVCSIVRSDGNCRENAGVHFLRFVTHRSARSRSLCIEHRFPHRSAHRYRVTDMTALKNFHVIKGFVSFSKG